MIPKNSVSSFNFDVAVGRFLMWQLAHLHYPLLIPYYASFLSFQFSIPLSFSQHHNRPRADEACLSHSLAPDNVTIYVVGE